MPVFHVPMALPCLSFLRPCVFLWVLFPWSLLAAQEREHALRFLDPLYEQYDWRFFSLMVSEIHDTLDWNAVDHGLLNAAFFYATNKAREENGSRPLTFSPALRNTACFHADQMRTHRFVSHGNPQNPLFDTLEERSRLFSADAKGENVSNEFLINYESNQRFYRVPTATGYVFYYNDGTPIGPHTYWSFANALVTNFLLSPPHRVNLLSPAYRSLGCGVATETLEQADMIPMGYGVQNFGTH